MRKLMSKVYLLMLVLGVAFISGCSSSTPNTINSGIYIEANSINRNEAKGVTTFTGNVKIKRLNDELKALKVVIHANENGDPKSYRAYGNVSFYILTKDNTAYIGRSQRLIFTPVTNEYKLYKNVRIQKIVPSQTKSDDKMVISTSKKVIINVSTGDLKIIK